MLSKKVGMITLGATAALVAAAPLASATEGHSGGHEGHGGGKACAFNGGDAGAASEISGDAGLANAVTQTPLAGNNIANLANCSDFLNNNLNGNLSGNSIALL